MKMVYKDAFRGLQRWLLFLSSLLIFPLVIARNTDGLVPNLILLVFGQEFAFANCTVDNLNLFHIAPPSHKNLRTNIRITKAKSKNTKILRQPIKKSLIRGPRPNIFYLLSFLVIAVEASFISFFVYPV